MKNKLISAFIMILSLFGIANAAENVIPLRGGVCPVRIQNKDGVVQWNCEYIGKVEIRQIYAKGFRVVGVFLDNAGESVFKNQYLIIEEQRR